LVFVNWRNFFKILYEKESAYSVHICDCFSLIFPGYLSVSLFSRFELHFSGWNVFLGRRAAPTVQGNDLPESNFSEYQAPPRQRGGSSNRGKRGAYRGASSCTFITRKLIIIRFYDDFDVVGELN
jgi:hypothetical protein